jgi:hypothetical protein
VTDEVERQEHPGPAAVLKVVKAAHQLHPRGCAPEFCGGSGLDPCSLFNALEALGAVIVEEAGGQEEPGHWEPSSWQYVKPGDHVRLGEAEATVETALPMTWVGSGASQVQVVLEGKNDGRPYTMPPSGAVDVWRPAMPDWAAHAFKALADAGLQPWMVEPYVERMEP